MPIDLPTPVSGSGPITGTRITIYEDAGGSWSALYVDGKLVQCADHYLVVERLVELTGVDWRQDAAFIAPGGNTALTTVEAVEARVAQRETALADADALELQAKRLTEEAAELRKQWRS